MTGTRVPDDAQEVDLETGLQNTTRAETEIETEAEVGTGAGIAFHSVFKLL